MHFFSKVIEKIRLIKRIDNLLIFYNNQINEFINSENINNQRRFFLDKVLNSSKCGVSNVRHVESDIIVSLTSYGKRIHEVYLAIESIMQGSMLPNRIILWLSEDEFKKSPLPITLQKQIKRGLEIRYTKDLLSYKKLIPSLKEYPDSTIITIDDDVMYNFDFVENLINSYIGNPHNIHANRLSRISFDKNNAIESYLKWENVLGNNLESRLDYLFTGVGGVLYPPHSLAVDVFDEGTFMSICRYADDVWFTAMAIKQGTKISKAYTRDNRGDDFIPLYLNQSDGLCVSNNNSFNCRNDIQIKAVFEKYGIIDILRNNEDKTKIY